MDPRKTPPPTSWPTSTSSSSLAPTALALGMAKIIIDNGWQDKEFVEKYTYGFEQYAAEVKKYDLKKVAGHHRPGPLMTLSGPPSYTPPAAPPVHESPSPGDPPHQRLPELRAILCLNALTGNFDRAGGVSPVTATYYDQCAGYHTL